MARKKRRFAEEASKARSHHVVHNHLRSQALASEFLNSTAPALRDPANVTVCAGKEIFANILLRSEMQGITADTCKSLPTEDQVSNLYGDGPVVHGLDTCQAYQALREIEPAIRVAGLYNTGTNALEHALNDNIEDLGKHQYYEVPWGYVSFDKLRE